MTVQALSNDSCRPQDQGPRGTELAGQPSWIQDWRKQLVCVMYESSVSLCVSVWASMGEKYVRWRTQRPDGYLERWRAPFSLFKTVSSGAHFSYSAPSPPSPYINTHWGYPELSTTIWHSEEVLKAHYFETVKCTDVCLVNNFVYWVQVYSLSYNTELASLRPLCDPSQTQAAAGHKAVGNNSNNNNKMLISSLLFFPLSLLS